MGAAGGVGLLIGVGSIVWGWWEGNSNLRLVGVLYVCVALGVLAARQAMAVAADARRAHGGGRRGPDDALGNEQDDELDGDAREVSDVLKTPDITRS